MSPAMRSLCSPVGNLVCASSQPSIYAARDTPEQAMDIETHLFP